MNYPDNYKFSKEHEWVFIDGSIASIGITELAKQELGEIQNIEITGLNKQLNKGQVCGRITSDKFLAKLIMPIDGLIFEINSKLIENAAAINDKFSPDRWIVKIKIDNGQTTDHLLSLDEYKLHKSDGYFHMIKYLLSSKKT